MKATIEAKEAAKLKMMYRKLFRDVRRIEHEECLH